MENVGRGDVVFLNFTRGHDPEHLGLVIKDSTPSSIYTVEGNTSAYGSQDNGGIVMEKLRRHDHVVAIWRPDYASLTDYTGRWSEESIRQCLAAGKLTYHSDVRRTEDLLQRTGDHQRKSKENDLAQQRPMEHIQLLVFSFYHSRCFNFSLIK